MSGSAGLSVGELSGFISMGLMALMERSAGASCTLLSSESDHATGLDGAVV